MPDLISPNPILRSDSYKYTHWLQYPERSEYVYQYWESRGGVFDEIVPFGFAFYLRRYLGTPITQEDIDEAEEMCNAHFGRPGLFNREGWEYILNEYNGYLPLMIKAVPEGTVVPTSNVLMTIENTDPKCYWLPSFMETMLSHMWYSTTVATLSREAKKIIAYWLEESSDSMEGLPFKLHDFGFRGVGLDDLGAIGGAAHLVNFLGTDTFLALSLLRNVYNIDMAGFSIPAAEHSTITSHETEDAAFRQMIKAFGADGIYAVVSDSYDFYDACRRWGTELKDEVLAAGGMLVVRPDSGDPVEVVPNGLKILDEGFGHTVNSKGYKLLNNVRMIQGDGVTLDQINEILRVVVAEGYSADNLAFGMGAGLLQKVNRDNGRFAIKCSSITIDGEDRDVWKKPATDSGKNSKRGRLMLVDNRNGDALPEAPHSFLTLPASGWLKDELRMVYYNGVFSNTDDFSIIRTRAEI